MLPMNSKVPNRVARIRTVGKSRKMQCLVLLAVVPLCAGFGYHTVPTMIVDEATMGDLSDAGLMLGEVDLGVIRMQGEIGSSDPVDEADTVTFTVPPGVASSAEINYFFGAPR